MINLRDFFTPRGVRNQEQIISLLQGIDSKQQIIINVTKEVIRIMSKLDDSIKELQDKVSAETTVEQSAIALLNGIPALIADAVTKASAAGATDDQLKALTDLSASIQTSSEGLAAAITANTPAPAPAPESVPGQ